MDDHDRSQDDPATIDIPIDRLRASYSPRELAIDQDHVLALAETFESLPPILVHDPTMAIIDGVHRVAAARLLHHTTIAARPFRGTDTEALVEAVRHNIRHGKPLRLGERKGAAARLLSQHADWSDRRIAAICGISPKTVARLRGTEADDVPQSRTRTGRDGRIRPVDNQAGHRRIAEELARTPDAPLRAIARATGSSVSTVRRVRDESLVADRPPNPERPPAPASGADHMWQHDSALTATPEGRAFGRWLDRTEVSDATCEPFVESIPLSRAYETATEARRRAAAWSAFADHLEERVRHRHEPPA